MKTKLFAVLAFALLGLFGSAFAQDGTSSAKLNWSTNFDASLEKAKAEKKPMFVYFTGSDWCPFCIYMERDVLSKPEFIEYANKNLVMVLCDFPREVKQDASLKAKNKALAAKYSINGFPTVLLLNPINDKKDFAYWEKGITPKSVIEKIKGFVVKSELK